MTDSTRIAGDGVVLRPWQAGDEASLVRHANSRAVWRNLLGGFPHPYRQEDAQWWIREAQGLRAPVEHLAIEVSGEAVGGIGLGRLSDTVYTHTRDFGYWIGEAVWGRGIATRVVGLFVPHAMRVFDLERMEASVFAWNPASARVLEKNGFQREGTMRHRVFKDGQFTDVWLYAKVRGE